MLRQRDITSKKEEAHDLVQITEASLALLDLIFPRHIIEFMTREAANTGATACLPATACYCLNRQGHQYRCYCLLLPATGKDANTVEDTASVERLASAAAQSGSSATQQGLAVAGSNQGLAAAGSKPSAATLCLRTLNSGNDFRHLTTHHEQVQQGGGAGSDVRVRGRLGVCGGVGLGV